MIEIKEIKVNRFIPAYKISSTNGVTIKGKNSTKEYDSITAFKRPDVNDYVECQTSLKNYFKNKRYNDRVKQLIHEEYSIDDEIAINRQRDVKQDEYKVYFNYCEQCKVRAHKEVYGN